LTVLVETLQSVITFTSFSPAFYTEKVSNQKSLATISRHVTQQKDKLINLLCICLFLFLLLYALTCSFSLACELFISCYSTF